MSQDFSLYGIFDSYVSPIDNRKQSEIYSKCFQGIGLTTCIPVLPDDDVKLDYIRDYLVDLEDISGANYCVECCGDSPSSRDIWDLYCEVDEDTRRSTNVFGFELRLARNRDAQDQEVIKCPLKRTGCSYTKSGEVIGECVANTETFLVGYELTLNVREYDKNTELWRGVESCELKSYEDPVALESGEKFHEKIILVHAPDTSLKTDDYMELAFLSFLIIVVVYVGLYFCRKKRCEYCQQKLVCFPRICYKCTFVGAEPPDPILLAALEQKGQKLQGDPPEQFPGSRAIAGFFRACCYTLSCGYWCYGRPKVYPDDPPMPKKRKNTAGGKDGKMPSEIQEGNGRPDSSTSTEVEPFSTIEDVERGQDNDYSNTATAFASAAGENEPDVSGEAAGEGDTPTEDVNKKKKKKSKKPKKNKNPNVLPYTQDIIASAVISPSTAQVKTYNKKQEAAFMSRGSSYSYAPKSAAVPSTSRTYSDVDYDEVH